MKLARFARSGLPPSYGIVDDDELVVLAGDPIFQGYETTGERVGLGGVQLLAPVIPRSKVLCIGKNFQAHVEEMGFERGEHDPLAFLKPNTAVTGPGAPIVIRAGVEHVQPEGELAVVIGRVGKDIPAENWLDYVFGFTVGNDVSGRALQRLEGQWARAKGYDTFCPLGPVIETEYEWTDARIETRINGELVQRGEASEMLHGVPEIVAFLSSICTLLPGDVILTGSPSGLRDLAGGDAVSVSIDGIGTLENVVVAE